MSSDTQMKRDVRDLLGAFAAGAPGAEVYAPGARMDAGHPWGWLEGPDAIGAWRDELRAAIPGLRRRDLILVGGENRSDPRFDRNVGAPRAPWIVAALGHYAGTMTGPLRGIPATGAPVLLRYGEAHWLEGGRLRESRVILDLVDLMRQCGTYPLPRAYGVEGPWQGPATQDGLRLPGPDWTGPDALETVFAMHEALHAFDGRDLATMDHERFWTPDFLYHAAGGIGTCQGPEGFRAHHQIPFLRAWPDRAAEGHFVRVSDGPYAVTGGVVTGTHVGEYLGMTPTGRGMRMPVMDVYRIGPDGRIAENWLPADIAGMAAGLGADLLARSAHYAGAPPRAL